MFFFSVLAMTPRSDNKNTSNGSRMIRYRPVKVNGAPKTRDKSLKERLSKGFPCITRVSHANDIRSSREDRYAVGYMHIDNKGCMDVWINKYLVHD